MLSDTGILRNASIVTYKICAYLLARDVCYSMKLNHLFYHILENIYKALLANNGVEAILSIWQGPSSWSYASDNRNRYIHNRCKASSDYTLAEMIKKPTLLKIPFWNWGLFIQLSDFHFEININYNDTPIWSCRNIGPKLNVKIYEQPSIAKVALQ